MERQWPMNNGALSSVWGDGGGGIVAARWSLGYEAENNMMKTTVLALGLMVGAFSIGPGSAEVTWSTDYKAALATAQKESKIVLADFTGTEWCIWCKRLKAEVF